MSGERVTEAQKRALHSVATWSEHGTYMPMDAQMRTFEACERKGLVEWRSVEGGSTYNGYALTEAGIAILATLTPENSNDG